MGFKNNLDNFIAMETAIMILLNLNCEEKRWDFKKFRQLFYYGDSNT